MLSIDFKENKTEKKIKSFPQQHNKQKEIQFQSTRENTQSNILVEIEKAE